MGDEDGVLDCKDELLNIQEEYLQDEIDRESLQKLAPTRAREAEKEKKVKLIEYFLLSWLLARFLNSISGINLILLCFTNRLKASLALNDDRSIC